MTVFAVDPGPTVSAWVLFNGHSVQDHGIIQNEVMVAKLVAKLEASLYGFPAAIVFEQIESYGMPVGREIFATVFWTGRFYQAALGYVQDVVQLPRRAVKLHLCQSARAKDSNVRQALIDRFGGLEKARGKKASKGPLYGLKADEWSALAVAVTWWDLHRPVDVDIPWTVKAGPRW